MLFNNGQKSQIKLLDKNFLNKLNETDKILDSSLSNKEKRKALSEMLSVITDSIRLQDESANTIPLIKLIFFFPEVKIIGLAGIKNVRLIQENGQK